MIQGFLPVASDQDLGKIDDAVRQLLFRTGMRVESEVLLRYLRAYGAKVDMAGRIAYFSPALIDRTIDLCRRSNRHEENDVLISRKMSGRFTQDWGYECFFLYDWDKQERRGAATSDVVDLIKIGEALPEISSVGLPVLDSSTNQKVEAIEAIELLYTHTGKHRCAGIRTAEQVKYVAAIDRALGYGPADPHFVQVGRCLISPLRFPGEAARIFEELIACGYTERFWVATMPISGATAPVTMAGSVALAAAEILGGWSVIKAVNEKAAAAATVISGILDMKSAKPSFSAPEAVLQDCCLWQLFKRIYQLDIGFDSGGYTDAKIPGFQAAYEKTFRQMGFGMLAGVGLTLGALDSGRTFSPLQAMLDLEFNRGIWKFFEGMEINDETIALREMGEIAFGENKTYLELDHTVRHFRRALWTPEFLDRTPWEDPARELAKEKRMLERADEKWRAALRSYQPPAVDKDKARAVAEIVGAARKDLLG